MRTINKINHLHNNKSTERVGIIIPVYNTVDYLDKCINSIINQSYINIVLFLIDDGSTDNSGIVCDEYSTKDNRINTIHIENSGPAKARNIGLSSIEKEDVKYVLFVDSDDYLEKNAIQILVDKAEYAGADIVVGVSCGLRNGKFVYKRDCKCQDLLYGKRGERAEKKGLGERR